MAGQGTYRASLHTHTWRCQHAEGDAADYVAHAAAGGCPLVGISDHTPLPDGRWPDVRMRMDELDAYVAAVQAARLAHPQLCVLLALECEWTEEYAAFYREELLGRRACDYLIGSVHYIPWEGGWKGCFGKLDEPRRLAAYVRQLILTMESGLFAFIAHPDLYGNMAVAWGPDQVAAAGEICQAARALGVPLELNAYGLRKPAVTEPDGLSRPGYPWPPFWEVAAAEGVEVVLSSDAHRPQDVLAGWAELEALRLRFGLREAILDL